MSVIHCLKILRSLVEAHGNIEGIIDQHQLLDLLVNNFQDYREDLKNKSWFKSVSGNLNVVKKTNDEEDRVCKENTLSREDSIGDNIKTSIMLNIESRLDFLK